MSRLVRFIFLLAALLPCDPAHAVDRFAVLVGIGKYDPATVVPGRTAVSGAGSSIDLKGPPNDLALMQEVLSYYSFSDHNTKVLADSQATRQGIIDAVKQHLLSLPTNSLAVFYYSGHGSALKSMDGQGESTDETIVPYDGRIGGQEPRDIVDDEIYNWIDALNANGVTAVFILDSCFSGGGARVGGGDVEETKTISAAMAPSRGSRDGVFSLRGGVPGRGGAVAILTASEAYEPSRSRLTSRGHLGVFTAALHDVLLPTDNVAPPVKWGEAMDRVAAALKPDETVTQTPRMFGNRDAPIFDSEGPFSNSVQAERVAADRATMSAGSDLGVTEGSVFKLFGKGQIPWVSSPRYEARARVAGVTATSAELQVIDDRLLASETLAAVEFEYVIPGRKIRVGIPPRGKINPFDRSAIVSGLGKFADIGDGPAELRVSLQNGQWTLETVDGRWVGDGIPSGNSELLRAEISTRFNDYARWMRLINWKRRGLTRALQVRYRVALDTPSGPKLIEPADLAVVKIAAGSRLQLLVENRGPRRVQIDVLLLRPNFTIGVCPLGLAERGQELSTEPIELGTQTGAAAWKIIVSDPAQKLSFLFLANDGARGAGAASLEDEFARVWNGVGALPRTVPDGQSFWKTFDVPFQATAAPQQTSIPATPKRCLGVAEK